MRKNELECPRNTFVGLTFFIKGLQQQDINPEVLYSVLKVDMLIWKTILSGLK